MIITQTLHVSLSVLCSDNNRPMVELRVSSALFGNGGPRATVLCGAADLAVSLLISLFRWSR